MTDERTWERFGAITGLGFIVLTLVATFLYPQQPRVDSAPAVTLKWVHDHHTGIKTGMVLGLFGAALLFWFVGHLRHVLHDERLSPIVFGSGIGLAVVSALAAVPLGLLAFMDAQGGITSPDVVRLLGDLTTVLYAVATAVTMVFLFALGLAISQKELASPWLAWVSLLGAVLNGIAVVESMTFSTYHGAAWAIPGWGAFIGLLLVVLGISVSLLRARAVSPDRPTVVAAAA
ncbi:MAG TPA: hypothetical protein VFA84_11320 [Acidimicrobiales bacterium]|nr:hypothetical protein [Acidimicrobiales bacterium]